jgi:DNA-directed RNA polymerase subunit K/omega
MIAARPPRHSPYAFAVVSALRAHQLMAGCVPRVTGEHKATMLAQMEVEAGHVVALPSDQATSTAGGTASGGSKP